MTKCNPMFLFQREIDFCTEKGFVETEHGKMYFKGTPVIKRREPGQPDSQLPDQQLLGR